MHADTPPSLTGVPVQAIAAGNHHGLALTQEGEVVAWGMNQYGATDVPDDLGPVVAVAGGGWHSMALTAEGRVRAWGLNSNGETLVPADLTEVIAIDAAPHTSLALRADGTVVAWGGNGLAATNVPPGLDDVVAIAAGDGFNLALQQDGSVVVWGRNPYWQPTDLPADLGRATAIAAGFQHGFAIVLPNSIPTGTEVDYVPAGFVWRYNDTGSDPGTQWRNLVYDDSVWGNGPAQLGYGDGDEATVIESGPQGGAHHVTSYFRRRFTAANPLVMTNLSAWLLHDDGAVVYLNGVEVARINMPAGPIGNNTLASGVSQDNATATFTLDPALLLAGDNLVAVEVHQSDVTSSDVSFDFRLTGTAGPGLWPPRPGSLDRRFTGRLNEPGSVLALARQPADGRFLVGGFFSGINGADQPHFTRLLPDGALDPRFAPAPPDDLVRSVLSLSSGDMLIGGNFLRIGNAVRPGVAKLGAEGGLRTAFFPEIGEPNYINATLEQPDGWLLLAGFFDSYGQNQGHVLDRFDPNIGGFDLPFARPEADNDISCMALQPDGRIVVGGGFSTIAGQARAGVARFHTNGTLDDGFNQGTGVVPRVRTLVVQPDGRILVGGDIHYVHGVLTHNLARLNADGSLDATFHRPWLDFGFVNALALQPDGRILVAGDFRTVDGQPYGGIVRLHPNGTIDPSFDPGEGVTGTDAEIHAMLLLPGGSILIGGEFSGYDGVPVQGLARLHGGGGPAGPAFVERFIEGARIELVTAPPTGTSVHAVEDHPPTGWDVVEITEGGVFDVLTGKVKFGPYYDDQTRVLAYRVVPPQGAQGVFGVSGQASADGMNSPIGGATQIVLAGRHPADQAPSDGRLEIQEITAYGAAWRQGAPWPAPPSPIPIDYATRAGALWRMGECYELDPGIPNPPLWWVPCTGEPGGMAGAGGVAEWGERVMPATFLPGNTLTVTLSIQPPAAASAFAVEESIPPGWSVAAVSRSGVFNAAQGTVRWGPFMDAQPRQCTYQAVSPEAALGPASFSGTVSVDGMGNSVSGVSESEATCRLVSIQDEGGGRFVVELEGVTGASFMIEASGDLDQWDELGVVTPVDGRIVIQDPESGALERRFYRLRRVP